MMFAHRAEKVQCSALFPNVIIKILLSPAETQKSVSWIKLMKWMNDLIMSFFFNKKEDVHAEATVGLACPQGCLRPPTKRV